MTGFIPQRRRHEYPREDGLDAARRAKASAASVCFSPEWGLKGVAGDGENRSGYEPEA